MSENSVFLDGHKVSIADINEISRFYARTSIHANAVKRMKQSRGFVEDIAERENSVYGINTGFGPLSRTRISKHELGEHQINLIHHLSVGQGDLFSDDEVRAIMAARANALARGFSGIRPEVVNRLVDFLNHRIYPEIPSEGSVGASGDLVPLAHLARALLGLGFVRHDNRRISCGALLKRFGWKPVVLGAKEGLALVNGTSVMTGLAALRVQDAETILSISELLSAFYVQLMFGEPEPFCNRAAFARGHRGQACVSERIAGILKNSARYKREIEQHKWGSHEKPVDAGIDIQDPYSLRCVPQILGAVQDALWHVRAVVTQELNATTDNPLIFPDEKMVIHCGNFYGQHVSFVMDYLRIIMAKLALLTERQTERLLNEKYNMGLPPMLSQGKLGLNSGLMGCQLLATSLAAEIRILTTPASVQTIPTNANNQDVVSMGCISSKMAGKLLELVWKVLAIQSIAVCQAFDLRNQPAQAGKLLVKFHSEIRKISGQLKQDRPLYGDISGVTGFLKSREFSREFLVKRPGRP